MAAIEEELFSTPWLEPWGLTQRWKYRAIARPSPGQSEVRLDHSCLGRQSGPHALLLNLSSKLASMLRPAANLEPDDSHQTSAIEGPDVAQLELETGRLQLDQPLCDALRHRGLDSSKEAKRQMQIRGRNPAKVWRGSCAGGQKRREFCALRLRHRQAEERPDLQRRAGAFQLRGAHVLGAVGRQP